MKYYGILLGGLILSMVFLMGCSDAADQQEAELESDTKNVLVFSKTGGWRHDSIETAQEALRGVGEAEDINFLFSEDADMFEEEFLTNFDAVIFLMTSQDVFEDHHRQAFKSYIRGGGGFVGVHSASDTEHDWPWFGALVGAYFEDHPNHPNVREAVVEVVDANHPATKMLPARWERADEWYNFYNLSDEINVLLKMDTDSYEGSGHPGNHPIAWYHEYDGGRSFYTALGHTHESYSEPLFMEHLIGGLRYAMGTE